jgi:hypothetical protein
MHPICDRCLSGQCRRCKRRVRAAILGPAFDHVGRPRARWMQCGWGCGSWLTSHEMRGHFTRCLKRPADLPQVNYLDRRRRNWKAKPGRQPGPRMLCGWRCGARLAACGRISITARCGRGLEVLEGSSPHRAKLRGGARSRISADPDRASGRFVSGPPPSSRNSAAVRRKKRSNTSSANLARPIWIGSWAGASLSTVVSSFRQIQSSRILEC